MPKKFLRDLTNDSPLNLPQRFSLPPNRPRTLSISNSCKDQESPFLLVNKLLHFIFHD